MRHVCHLAFNVHFVSVISVKVKAPSRDPLAKTKEYEVKPCPNSVTMAQPDPNFGLINFGYDPHLVCIKSHLTNRVLGFTLLLSVGGIHVLHRILTRGQFASGSV